MELSKESSPIFCVTGHYMQSMAFIMRAQKHIRSAQIDSAVLEIAPKNKRSQQALFRLAEEYGYFCTNNRDEAVENIKEMIDVESA